MMAASVCFQKSPGSRIPVDWSIDTSVLRQGPRFGPEGKTKRKNKNSSHIRAEKDPNLTTAKVI